MNMAADKYANRPVANRDAVVTSAECETHVAAGKCPKCRASLVGGKGTNAECICIGVQLVLVEPITVLHVDTEPKKGKAKEDIV